MVWGLSSLCFETNGVLLHSWWKRAARLCKFSSRPFPPTSRVIIQSHLPAVICEPDPWELQWVIRQFFNSVHFLGFMLKHNCRAITSKCSYIDFCSSFPKFLVFTNNKKFCRIIIWQANIKIDCQYVSLLATCILHEYLLHSFVPPRLFQSRNK